MKERLLAGRQVVGECWHWSGCYSRDGYGVLTVGRGTQRRVHRVAYEAFVGAVPAGMLVCHRCDNPRCFRPDHLFLGTHSDNVKDMHRKGRAKVPVGERHPQAKLSAQAVHEIRARRARGDRLVAIAADYGVAFQTVSSICTGRAWRHA